MSRIAILPGFENVLVSGGGVSIIYLFNKMWFSLFILSFLLLFRSVFVLNQLYVSFQDSTLRFWDYKRGKQLHCESLRSPDKSHDDEGQQQIVTGISCCQKHGLVAVTLLK